MKSRRSKATDITNKVKRIVYDRDEGRCIICGRPGYPNSHYISRAKGGLGIPENIVTMCIECHNNYDNGSDLELKNYIKDRTKEYLKRQYISWNEENLYYKKY